MAKTVRDRIIEAIVTTFGISKEDLEDALALHKNTGVSLDKALIEKGLISEKDLMVVLVRELQIPFINLKKYRIDPSLQDIISERIARQYHIVPLSSLQDTVTVAISDPLNVFAIDDLKSLTGREIDVVMSTDSAILEAIENYYGGGLQSSLQDVRKDISEDEFEIISETEGQTQDDLSADEAEQAPIIRLVNLVIKEGIKQRASDIHIEPMADVVRVRYRIDGVLRDAMKIPKDNQSAVMVRLKIMARMDITTARVPQDGRFKMRIGGQEVDFRVSLLPTTFGQKAVLRILDKSSLSVGFDGLGFSPDAVEQIKKGAASPFGMILVTGPTGSGKSTTLYSMISSLNTVDKNIITIEDPVEYLIEGLTQIQVKPEIGLTFASGLRAILRQSPDIVMVGEIRDFETADIAIKASLTGQLVLSTLHTNDAAGALTRLVDMGVEPFLVASSLVMVVAQRLCRRVCRYCKKEVKISPKVLEGLGFPFAPKTVFYEGKGCDRCRKTGYLGRMGVTELLEITDEIRELLIRGKSSDEIKKYARDQSGMKTLYEDVMAKMAAGETTLEEALRVTSGDA